MTLRRLRRWLEEEYKFTFLPIVDKYEALIWSVHDPLGEVLAQGTSLPHALAEALQWVGKSYQDYDIEPERPPGSRFHDDATCPFCGSVHIDFDSIEIDEGHVFQRADCQECHAEWDNRYELKGYQVLSEPF